MSKIKFSEDITWHDLLVRIALVIISVVLIVWAMPRDSQITLKAEMGKPWRHADFTAPFDFPIYKPDAVIKAERDSIMREYEPYYGFDSEMEGKMVSKFTQDFAEGIPGLTPDFISIIANRLHQFYNQGIMNAQQYSELIKDTTRMIRIVNGKQASSERITTIYSPKLAYEELFQDPVLSPHRVLLQRCNLNDYITPNLIYEKERSEAILRDLQESIPLASGVAQRGQKIVDRGQIVDEKTYRIIESYKATGRSAAGATAHRQLHHVPQSVPQRLLRTLAFHHHGLFHDRALLCRSVADGEPQRPAHISAAFRHGAHLRPRIYGLAYGLHDARHDHLHCSQCPTTPARLHHH